MGRGTPSKGTRASARTLGVALAASTTVVFPALLTGAFGVLLQQDLGFGELGLGGALGAFFAAAAAASLPSGAISSRIGPKSSMVAGLAGSALGCIGIAVFATSWLSFAPWLVLAGASFSLCQVGAQHLLATEIPPQRQGIAFGIQQSAVPLAAIVAGLALPLIALTADWRYVYVGGALAGPIVMVLVGAAAPAGRERSIASSAGDAPRLALIILAIGAGGGTAAANALTGFTVSSLAHAGFAQDAAGVVLTAGSVLGAVSRVTAGWLADRIGRGSLLLVGGLLAIGTVGYLGLAVPAASGTWLVAASLVAFAGGWGYQALILLAVTRTNPNAPAPALALVRMGPAIGAVVGPIGFGALVDAGGYGIAWLGAAGVAGGATVMVELGRRMLHPVRQRLLREAQAVRDADVASQSGQRG